MRSEEKKTKGLLNHGKTYVGIDLGSTTVKAVVLNGRVLRSAIRPHRLKALEGWNVGLLKHCFMRPFPEKEIMELSTHVKAIGVIDKDISFGYEGTVFANVNSALSKARTGVYSLDFIAGLGGGGYIQAGYTGDVYASQ